MSSKNNPLISIIVPVYNTQIYSFERCIKSLVNQTYRQLEIIIIDDGSTPENAKKYREILKQYPDIIHTRQRHSGVSTARNLGLQKSTGEYIMFVDSDDYLDIDCCNSAISVATYTTDLIYFSYTKHYPNHDKQVNFADSPYDMSVLGTSCMKLYKKLLIGTARFDETLKNAEDVEFNFRIFQNIKNPTLLKEHFYHYEIRQNSSVRKFQKDYILYYLRTIDKMQRLLREDSTNNQLRYLYYDFLAISYLMILLNFIYHPENHKPHKAQLKQLEQQDFVRELFSNYDKLSLPLTRKLIVFFGKHKFYTLISFAIRIKKELDK